MWVWDTLAEVKNWLSNVALDWIATKAQGASLGDWGQIIAAVAAAVTLGIIAYQMRLEGLRHGTDLLLKFSDRFHCQEMRAARRAAASSLIESRRGQLVPSSELTDVLNFFEQLGLLARRKLITKKMVWNTFYMFLTTYLSSDSNRIDRARESQPLSFEHAIYLLKKLDRFHGRLTWRLWVKSLVRRGWPISPGEFKKKLVIVSDINAALKAEADGGIKEEATRADEIWVPARDWFLAHPYSVDSSIQNGKQSGQAGKDRRTVRSGDAFPAPMSSSEREMANKCKSPIFIWDYTKATELPHLGVMGSVVGQQAPV
jgi:hypothetical protein